MTPSPSCHGELQLWFRPIDSGKGPSRAPSLGPGRPGSGRGFPAAGAAVRRPNPAEPCYRRGRRWGASPRAAPARRAGRGRGWRREASIFPGQPASPHRAGRGRERRVRAPPLPRAPLLFAESRAAGEAAARRLLSGRGEPRAVSAPATLRPPGARLLPVRVRVCRAAAASWGQQRRAGRGERGSSGAPWPRRQRPLAAPAVET